MLAGWKIPAAQTIGPLWVNFSFAAKSHLTCMKILPLSDCMKFPTVIFSLSTHKHNKVGGTQRKCTEFPVPFSENCYSRQKWQTPKKKEGKPSPDFVIRFLWCRYDFMRFRHPSRVSGIEAQSVSRIGHTFFLDRSLLFPGAGNDLFDDLIAFLSSVVVPGRPFSGSVWRFSGFGAPSQAAKVNWEGR